MLETLHKRPAPLAKAAPTAPPDLAALVMRLLAADPDERPSASELLAHLEALRTLHPDHGHLAELLANEPPAASEDGPLHPTLRTDDTLLATTNRPSDADAAKY